MTGITLPALSRLNFVWLTDRLQLLQELPRRHEEERVKIPRVLTWLG